MLDSADRDTRRLAVFSHPNHELGVFGLVQRLRPHLLFLSDGGGPERVAETQRGLASISAAGQARYVRHREAAFYAALVNGDTDFCRRVVAEIGAIVDEIRPQEILCDAVEFYNPVHDLCLPLVLAALSGRADPPAVFEVPLIYQRPAAEEAYEIQRLPPSQRHDQRELRLTDAEVAAKRRARSEIYGQLRAQLGALLDGLPTNHVELEVLRPFPGAVSQPNGERVLRYEWRGRALHARGEVAQVITYAGHYRPLTAALAAP